MSKEFFVQGKEYSSRMNEEGIHYYNNTHYSIPNTLYPLLTTQYPLPLTHYPIPNTLYPLLTTQYPIPNTLYPLLTTQYHLPLTHYPIPFTKILTGLSTLKTRINEKCKRNCKRKVWANCQSV